MSQKPELTQPCIPDTGWSDHSLHDAKSLAMHCKIAWKISKDPSLLDKAREKSLQRRENCDPGRIPRFQEEWEQILALPWPQIAAFLISVSEDAVRLRSSSPFAGLLTDAEREKILEAFRP